MYAFLWVLAASAAPLVREGASSGISTDGPYSSVAVSIYESCALRVTDLRVVCWGGKSNSRRYRPPDAEFTRLATSGMDTCGLTEEGSYLCWGPSRMKVRKRDGPVALEDLSVGLGTVCGPRGDGSIQCFGAQAMILTPVDSPLAEVDLGMVDLCVRDEAGQVACMGSHVPGVFTPPAVEMRDVEVHTSNFFACGVEIASGHTRCWGFGRPDAPAEQQADVARVVTGKKAIRATGSDAAYAATSAQQSVTGVVRSAGMEGTTLGTSMQISSGIVAAAGVGLWEKALVGLVPKLGIYDPPDEAFVSVTVGARHVCGLTNDGRAVCWGADATQPPYLRFRSLSAGASVTCGVVVDGRIACWGQDYRGTTLPP